MIPRPYRTPEIIADAIEHILADVVEWHRRGEEECRAALIKCAHTDAYHFAKNLDERCRWHPDFDLVQILSQYDERSARRKALQQWVKYYAITVQYKVGDIVKSNPHAIARFRVVEIDEAVAEVTVEEIDPPSPIGWITQGVETISGLA